MALKRTKKQIKEQGEKTAQYILDHFQNEIVKDWYYDASTYVYIDDLKDATMKALKKLVNVKINTIRPRTHLRNTR